MRDEPDSAADRSLLEDLRRASRKAARLGADPDGFDTAIGEALERYEIIRRIGTGGMGVVYEAEQLSPRRRVAIKLVKSVFPSRDLERRFAREVEVLARLEHPGIARVLEADTFVVHGERRPFFAMELVEGIPIDRFVDENRLDLRSRLELYVEVCAAVAHAHRKGVLHRDLKPSNILVTPEGRPKVLDFGVARPLEVHDEHETPSLRTRTGQLVGTLPFMSPEQVSRDPDAVDTRSDVYSLGLILFQLLAGRLPFDFAGKPAAELVRIVSSGEPLALRAVDAHLPRDLDTIVAKALEKDPERRYPSVEALSNDVLRFLREEPITARPPSTLYQLGKFTRRNRGIVVGLTTAFVILVAGTVVSTILALRARRASEDARLAEKEARREARTEERVNEFMAHVLGSDDTYGSPRPVDFTVRAAILEAEQYIAEDLEDEPLVEATVRVILGRLAIERGEPEQAVRHAERALALREQELGPDHEKTAAASNSLGVAHSEAGNTDEAERYLLRAARIYAPHSGEPEVDALLGTTMMNLARSSLNAGDLNLAEERLDRAIELHTASFGERSTWIARSLSLLAEVRRRQARPEEAVRLMQEACALHEESGELDDLAAAHAYGSLAGQLDSLSRHDESLELWEETVRIQGHLLGPEDEQVGRSRHRLGRALSRTGDPRRAREELDLALATLRLHPGAREYSAYVLYDLARIELGLEEPERALELLLESADICSELLAEDHELARSVQVVIDQAERRLLTAETGD